MIQPVTKNFRLLAAIVPCNKRVAQLASDVTSTAELIDKFNGKIQKIAFHKVTTH